MSAHVLQAAQFFDLDTLAVEAAGVAEDALVGGLGELGAAIAGHDRQSRRRGLCVELSDIQLCHEGALGGRRAVQGFLNICHRVALFVLHAAIFGIMLKTIKVQKTQEMK